MEASVTVNKELNGDTCTLYVHGVLDYSTMEPFVDEIRALEEGIKKVTVDFSGLDFIDSTGIGAIINLTHEANDKQFEVELVGINQEVQELFDTIGVFQIIDSLKKGDK